MAPLAAWANSTATPSASAAHAARQITPPAALEARTGPGRQSECEQRCNDAEGDDVTEIVERERGPKVGVRIRCCQDGGGDSHARYERHPAPSSPSRRHHQGGRVMKRRCCRSPSRAACMSAGLPPKPERPLSLRIDLVPRSDKHLEPRPASWSGRSTISTVKPRSRCCSAFVGAVNRSVYARRDSLNLRPGPSETHSTSLCNSNPRASSPTSKIPPAFSPTTIHRRVRRDALGEIDDPIAVNITNRDSARLRACRPLACEPDKTTRGGCRGRRHRGPGPRPGRARRQCPVGPPMDQPYRDNAGCIGPRSSRQRRCAGRVTSRPHHLALARTE